MKRIYFSNAGSVKYIVGMVIGVVAVIGLNFIKGLSYEQFYWYKILAYALVILFFGKFLVENLLLKNFVRWSKSAMFIKINSRKGQGMLYRNIDSHQFKKGVLIIKTPSQEFRYDLTPYRSKDVRKLLNILERFV